MRNIISSIIIASAALVTSCSDYLQIYPENQVSVDDFWSSKEDVNSALNSGYYTLRNIVQSRLIPWGEQRAGAIWGNLGIGAFQQYKITSSTGATNWQELYQIVNQANLVLVNADKAQGNDATYDDGQLNSHKSEAYFLRALANFYLVRNWREVPIVTVPSETDAAVTRIAKSSEEDVIAHIKSDLNKAIELDAAKKVWDSNAETKGRATIWSIYALMADVCLWSKDYDGAVKYADMLIKSNDSEAPQLITTASHDAWFSMFFPGNSKESIFEIQWNANIKDLTAYQTNTLYNDFYITDNDAYYRICGQVRDYFVQDEDLQLDYCKSKGMTTQEFNDNKNSLSCRTLKGTYDTEGNRTKIWKYFGGSTPLTRRTVNEFDQNFIIYRMAAVYYIKAEALIMKGGADDVAEAEKLINAIRNRSNLPNTTDFGASQQEQLQCLLKEITMELLAEGRLWYDMVRISRYSSNIKKMVITMIQQNHSAVVDGVGGTGTKASLISKVLIDDGAWFLPIYNKEMEANELLTQNKAYGSK